jgi:diguanylate cyclase (GGDEF)-like protein/PAS domain S-box-containing protein
VSATGVPDADGTPIHLATAPSSNVGQESGAAHPIADGLSALVGVAMRICGVPTGLLHLTDRGYEPANIRVGDEQSAVAAEAAFCARVIAAATPIVVPDSRADPIFAADSTQHASEVRFCAGVPLVADNGYVLGALSMFDAVPRELSSAQHEQLAAIAGHLVAHCELSARVAELAAEVERLRTSLGESPIHRQALDGLVRHSDAMIYAKDLDGRFLLANPALHRLLGQPDGTLAGRSNHEVFPPSAADDFERNDLAVAISGERQVFAEQLPHPDGTIHDYHSTKFPLRHADGEIYAVAGVSTDVTELAQQGRDNNEAKQRWRALVEHSPVPVAVVDSAGRFAYANPLAAALYGASGTADLIGRAAAEVVPPDGLESSTALFKSIIHGTAARGQRWTLRQLGGRLVDVEVNAARVEYGGKPAVQVELRDMSEQAAAESALRESETRWRNLVEGSPVGIGLANEHGHFITVNAALCALLGRPERELLGHAGAEFTHPDDLDIQGRTGDLIDDALGAVAHLEKRYVRPSGEERWAWLTLIHTPGPEGQQFTLAHFQDVTDRKASERSVVESEANLTAVANVIKHIQTGADARRIIVDAAVELAHAEYAALLEPIPSDDRLHVSAATDSRLLGNEVDLNTISATGEAFRAGQTIFVPDTENHPLVRAEDMKLTRPRSMLVVPVRAAESISAVLIVAWANQVPDLDDRRAAVATLLADHAGVALRQAMLVRELETLALTDALTGLPNRRGWENQLTLLFGAADRAGTPVTVALADLDHFKRFNDIHGHLVGDAFLRQFAAAGRAALRFGDVVARWGGEEFAIAMPNCGRDEAREALARLQRSVPLQQTCSVGYATWTGSETAAELMARADQALYTAKHAGRNRIQSAEELE